MKSVQDPDEKTGGPGTSGLERVARLYRDYLDQTAQLERERKPFDGILGFGGGPAAHPCHGQFIRHLKQAAEALTELPQQELTEILEYIYRAPLEQRNNQLVYWTFLAAHGATLPLIKRLDQARAVDLLKWYERAYPRRDRTPVQQDIVDLLVRRRNQW